MYCKKCKVRMIPGILYGKNRNHVSSVRFNECPVCKYRMYFVVDNHVNHSSFMNYLKHRDQRQPIYIEP